MLVLYIILFIVTIFFYILYIGNFSFYLFAFLLIIPVILFAIQIYLSRKIKVSFCKVQENTSRSKKVPVTLKIKNPTKIPAANLFIEIEYFNAADVKHNIMKINTPVFPNDTQYLTLHVSSKHYGTLKMKINKCRVTDMLKLFKIKLKYPQSENISKECSFTVIPQCIELENNIANYSEMGLETDEYSKYHKGDDPSEIFDIHEYNDGDKINRIHWNLSMKQDKTMVKDYSMPISNSIVLAVDLNIDTENKNYMSLYDTLIETVSSVSNYLTECETPHKILWHDCKNGELITINVTDEEEYANFAGMLLHTPLYSEKDLTMIDYINESERTKCGHLMYFSTKFNENIGRLMSDSDLAAKYSYMVITDKNNPLNAQDEFAEVIPIIKGMITQSVQDICF